MRWLRSSPRGSPRRPRSRDRRKPPSSERAHRWRPSRCCCPLSPPHPHPPRGAAALLTPPRLPLALPKSQVCATSARPPPGGCRMSAPLARLDVRLSGGISQNPNSPPQVLRRGFGGGHSGPVLDYSPQGIDRSRSVLRRAAAAPGARRWGATKRTDLAAMRGVESHLIQMY